MKELTDFLDKHGVEYTIDGEHVLVPGDVRLDCPKLTHLPVGGEFAKFFEVGR